MKTLENYCKNKGLKLVAVRYRHQFGYLKRKGFDIIKPSTNEILVSFEPKNIGEKWYLRTVHNNYKGTRYINRITEKFLNENITPYENSFFRILTK